MLKITRKMKHFSLNETQQHIQLVVSSIDFTICAHILKKLVLFLGYPNGPAYVSRFYVIAES